jgi:tripartite-type tricarboxylate transporter receptor subunit TctC
MARRLVLAGSIGMLAAPPVLRAEGTYPNRTVRYINPFPAGGATDTLSRLFCAKMAELTGQQWIVENRGGSGGNVGMDALAQSSPDGYTLGLGGIASHAIAPTLYAKLPFNPRADFTFVSTIWQLPNMLVVNLNLPVKTVPELIELLKKNPGKYSYGSAGSGTTLHLSGELFKIMAKVDMVHVPYRGAAPAMQDLLAGQIHMIFDNIPGSLAQWRPGKVRALGVTSAQRTPAVPDVPAIAETLPGLRDQLLDHAHRPGEAAAGRRATSVRPVEEGTRERRPQGEVLRSRGHGHLAVPRRHAGLSRF